MQISLLFSLVVVLVVVCYFALPMIKKEWESYSVSLKTKFDSLSKEMLDSEEEAKLANESHLSALHKKDHWKDDANKILKHKKAILDESIAIEIKGVANIAEKKELLLKEQVVNNIKSHCIELLAKDLSSKRAEINSSDRIESMIDRLDGFLSTRK